MKVWCLKQEIIGTSDFDSTTSALNEERKSNNQCRAKHLKALKRTYKWYQLKRIKNVLINKISKEAPFNTYSDTEISTW
jgi:hypothetical protein